MGWKRRGYVPDVPGQMFAPAEDHPALAVPATLEGLGWGGAITRLADA